MGEHPPSRTELEIRLKWIEEKREEHTAAHMSFDDVERAIRELVLLARAFSNCQHSNEGCADIDCGNCPGAASDHVCFRADDLAAIRLPGEVPDGD